MTESSTANRPPVASSDRPTDDAALAAAVTDVLETRGALARGPQRPLRRRLARRNLTRSAAVAAEIKRRIK